MKALSTIFGLILLLLTTSFSLKGQIARIHEYNTIAWFQLNTTFQINKTWGLHFDYNNRRVDFLENAMQSLFRFGINYNLSEKLNFRVGYAFVMNSPYGEYPINQFGKSYNENRIFQMISLTDNIGSLEIRHRLGLEQRWTDKYSRADLKDPDDHTYTNRIRYMVRLQQPLKKMAASERYPYLALYDELFISFGNEVNANVFDQNRLGILAGYRFNKNLKAEAGYINKIYQLSRKIDNNNVFQHNNGLQMNLIILFSTKQSTP